MTTTTHPSPCERCEDLLRWLADHPASSMVDALTSDELPWAEGTMWFDPHVSALAGAGRIATAGPVPVWVAHVQAFPRMHEPGAGLIARQAITWQVVA